MDDDEGDSPCPSCGGEVVLNIAYGDPVRPPGPGTVLGGCVVGADLKKWQCNRCGHRWGNVDRVPVDLDETRRLS